MRELYNALKENVVEVVFTKVNGERRTMKSTLIDAYLPKVDEKSSLRKSNANTIAVWSLDDNGWRSFKNDSVISWDVVK